jgi:hypothetical protein
VQGSGRRYRHLAAALVRGCGTLVVCAALLNLLAWPGCFFDFSAPARCKGADVHVAAASEVDLSKVSCIRAVVSGQNGKEYAMVQPSAGWPNDVKQYVCLDEGTVTITITAYDAGGVLVAVGTGQSVDRSAMNIELRSTVPWT